ncbi:hypothetical protein D6779_10450 [Candidatus Parcubacteria bacterium]|nr:MAG: hypothetical protein D6779_10450 [Candidatus Parcubacteria bacterium]
MPAFIVFLAVLLALGQAGSRKRRVKCEYREHKDERGSSCYRDNSGRPVLSLLVFGDAGAGMSVGACAAACAAELGEVEPRFVGLTRGVFGPECWCSMRPPRRGRGGEAVCDERCPGNSGERCGGRGLAMSVYARGECRRVSGSGSKAKSGSKSVKGSKAKSGSKSVKGSKAKSGSKVKRH